jgi:large conductance mechanosensitive channel
LTNFIILAFIIFLMVHMINKARVLALRKEAQAAVVETPPSEEVLLLREIRDALRQPGALQ